MGAHAVTQAVGGHARSVLREKRKKPSFGRASKQNKQNKQNIQTEQTEHQDQVRTVLSS
jgi:hypothetical protein